MAKKCTKKRNKHAKLFFCQSKPIAVVVIQKYCSHGNMTSHFSSRPMKIPGEFDPLSSHRPHLGIMAWLALGKQGYQLVYRILRFFRLAKTKPKRAKDARVETHSKEHPPRVFLCSPWKKRKNNLVLRASVARQVLPKQRREFRRARTWKKSHVLAFYIT